MIKNEQEFTPDELRQLDLLVDGELGDVERRNLLAALEARPDGWRRCALAFLEAQSWQRELRAFAPPEKLAEKKTASIAADVLAPVASPVGALVEPRPRGWWNAPSVGLPWAMAATFLVAFGLAWIIRAPGVRSGNDNTNQQVPVVSNLVAGGSKSTGASDRRAISPSEISADSVRLVMDDGTNGAREVELPIEDTNADDAWLTNRQPIVPRELRQALERMGHRVDERRQFLPMQLDDGRQMVVPVDQVEFTPVSATYQ